MCILFLMVIVVNSIWTGEKDEAINQSQSALHMKDRKRKVIRR